jgi:hypothetical protein
LEDGLDDTCTHLDQVDAGARPSAEGCEDCMRDGTTWVHLRMCRTCGHVGCCDASPNRHARAHNASSGHPLISTFEPYEDWWWCFVAEVGSTVPGQPDYSHP